MDKEKIIITTKKTSAQRVKELRQRRNDAGLVRMEIYANPLDHAAIKQFAAELQAERKKLTLPD